MNLSDPIWRLCNLYKIKDAKGRLVPFRPNAQQRRVIEHIHKTKDKNLLILKARQLGMSTVIDLIIADAIFWFEGVNAAIVDQTQSDATKKLRGKIKIAWENLPEAIREQIEIIKDNDRQFILKGIESDSQPSEVQAGMTARGDTFQILHISEWGPIQYDDAKRSEEIRTGAMPAAKEGIKIIETTWKGGKGGDLWDITKAAMETRPEDRTSEDFILLFFPWWEDPAYSLEGNVDQISPECRRYLDEIQAEVPQQFTPEQRLWYYKRAWPMGDNRFREYPTTLEECFKGSIKGAIYQEHVDRARASGRVIDFPWARDKLTYTFWDIGSPWNTVVWYAQFVGREIHLIDCDFELDHLDDLTNRMAWMRGKGYRYGGHYLPHDAWEKETGKNFAEQLLEKGMTDLRMIPRTNNIWSGINRAHELFPRFVFHATNCKRGLDGLEAYRATEDKSKAYISERPVHDWASHPADALRMLAEAELHGMLEGASSVASDSRKKLRRRMALR